jgi:uncharacterized protein YraI
MMKKNDSLLTNISHQTLRLGLMAVVVLSTLAACGGSTPKLTQATITSPAANAEVNVGDNVPIAGQANGENIVRVDVIVDSNIHATLTAEDMTAGVQSFPVQVNWTPAQAGTHFVQLDVYGPDSKPLGKSAPVIFSAKAPPVAPTVAPEPTATVAPPASAPTVAPTAATVLTTTDTVTGTTTTTTTTGSGATTLTPTLTITNDFANVRAGPSTDYQVVGQMQLNVSAPLRGKNAAGDWWQITFADGPNGLGWVFGELVRVDNAANVAVVEAPPLPTSAPTAAGPTATPPSVTGATPDPGATPAAVSTDAAPAATASVSGCTESSPDWRGSNPNYPFCAKQDLIWGDPQGDWNVYDNGKDIPLSISWNLYGDTIDQVWIRFDPSETACEFVRPAQNVVNTQVPAAGTYNFNVGQFAYGGTYRVYLAIQLKDGRVVTWGEKKLCIR